MTSFDGPAYATGLLTGERVRLRATTEADTAVMVGWQGDPRVRVTDSQTAVPLSEAGARTRIARWTGDDPGGIGLGVESLDSGEFVGHVGLFGMTVKDRCGNLGILIGPPFWGRGYGTDAVRVILGLAFRELGLHRVQLTVLAYNARGSNAYHRVGFVEEGRSREVVFHDGSWHDEVHMAILARDWPTATG